MTIKADAYVGALDVPGAKRMIPSAWRKDRFFDNIHKLVGVAVITVQLRYNGWVTEMQDKDKVRGGQGQGQGARGARTKTKCEGGRGG